MKKFLTSAGMARMTAAGLCLAMLLTGCGNDKSEGKKNLDEILEADSGTTAATTVPAETEPEIDPETMDHIKFNIYVMLNNEIVEVLDDLDEYYLVVADEEEFALLPDSQYTYKYGISPYNLDVLEDASVVVDMEPVYDGLDDLTRQILEPMEALMTTLDSIYSCYDFADNQYAKAKEFHKEIQANVGKFAELAYPYMEQIAQMGRERRAAEEQLMKDNGELIVYSVSHMITLVRNLLDECVAQNVYDENLSELDLTAIRPIYEQMLATAQMYDEAVADKDQLMKESLSIPPMDGLMEGMCSAVEWMIDQAQSGEPLPSPGCLGSLEHVEEVLGTCIDRYNSTFTE